MNLRLPTLLLCTVLAAQSTSRDLVACSKTGVLPLRSADLAHFIGIATPDTLAAGAGNVRYIVASGHFGRGHDRAIYGQRMTVERIGGLAAERLPAGNASVVLVPWDYAADCTPVPWSRSARWVEPGTRGFFYAALRDRAHWVDHLPTFDVLSPEVLPYPQQAARMRGWARGGLLLDIDQVFALVDQLPVAELLRDSADVAVQPLFGWVRANPELATREPAAGVLRYARFSAMQARLRRIDSPIAGTYRLVIALNNGPEHVLYVRTRARPSSAFNLLAAPSLSEDATRIPTPDGYYLHVNGRTDPDSLPVDCSGAGRDGGVGYIAVLNQPPETEGQRRVWTGKVEFDLFPRVLRGVEGLHEFALSDFERFSQRRRAGLPAETPARFVANGRGLRIEQTIRLDDGRAAILRGERISNVTISCLW